VTVVESRVSVWEALAGLAPGTPLAPADPGLWAAVAERLNPAKAKPVLRPEIETARLVSVRGVEYVMLRSPDRTNACYLRLTPEELALAQLMDGSRTVARLVAEFAKITGKLSPDQVTRVVADLAANRMLEELPLDAFRRLDRVHRRPLPARMGRGLLAAARGQRLVIARIDPLVSFIYKAGGRLLFTRVAAVLLGLVALVGLGLFVWTWAQGSEPVFLTGGSYATGALVLLGLNVLALACHELGHALATKHAGRRVPAAGFLVYFGIPSVFVDTTDVWMAGRRARLLTTAAGPATGMVLAGAAQLVALAYPPAAPWAFKLSFAWYLNVAFNLNPFLALDGYYLLMDWLEVPNLRARAMAWLTARLRRRPPRFGELDREGRLVALYGLLSMVWLIIAANLAYRIYLDRVGGLVTGLWRAGWPERLLLVAVVLGLAAPMVYVLFGWLGKRWRRLREALTRRSVTADAPRRFDALKASALGRLDGDKLSVLAADARWVRPRTGEQLVFAGAAQSTVYVVVDGALEGRRRNDPGGWVRERVGAGGVVGLAGAVTGAPSALAWHTAGTTLLAIPSSSLAGVLDPAAGPGTADRHELEYLFEHSPALSHLSAEDRLGLMLAAQPLVLSPGATLTLTGADDAVLVASGVLVWSDGTEIRAGALVGPYGEVLTGPVAQARSQVRAWVLPAIGGMPLLLGAGTPAPVAFGPGVAPAFGVHPPAGYPPLAAPPGEPPSTVDDGRDRKFERKLWWLLILLLLFALLLTGSNFLPGPAWGEMPEDRALLQVDQGSVNATVNGRFQVLHRGDDVYVGHTDQINVNDRSLGRLTFRGGGYTMLCAGSQLTVGPLSTAGRRPKEPSAALDLASGRVLADTAGTSRTFSPLNLLVNSGGGQATNNGAAWFALAGTDVTVAAGAVAFNGTPQPVVRGKLTCGDSTAGAIAPPPSPSDNPSSDEPSESPSASPSPSLSPTGEPTPTPTPTPTKTPGPTQTPTKTPSTPPTTTAPPPPPNHPPVIQSANPFRNPLAQLPPSGYYCAREQNLTNQRIYATVVDPDPGDLLGAYYTYTLPNGTILKDTMRIGDGIFSGPQFTIPYSKVYANGGPVTVTVHAFDSHGAQAKTFTFTFRLDPCVLTPIVIG
jgi:putative peptide zinc metalloprotease protein